jgi:hypothetical protein
MPQSTRRLGAVIALLALLVTVALAGCSSDTKSTSQKPTATSGPRATTTAQPGGTPTPGGTPSPTATPIAACNGALSDIPVPDNAVQIGPTTTAGATTSCMYRIPQDLQTLDTYFKAQMGKAGWRMLKDDPEGPQAEVQEYFKKEKFATISLSQDDAQTHTTVATIAVEVSQ